MAALAAVAAVLFAPGMVAALALLAGCTLLIAAVYLLAGAAWSLLAASVPLLFLGLILARGAGNA
jgi:hypothetical protein